MLDQLAFSANAHSLLTIEGPYGAAKYFPNLVEKYDRILLVAGGVGATFILPIYEQIIATATTDTRVKLVWSVRKRRDAHWGFREQGLDGSRIRGEGLQQQLGRNAELPASSLRRHISLYLTGAAPLDGPNGQQSVYDDEGIELQERSQPDIPNNNNDKEHDPVNSTTDMSIKAGRPNFGEIIDEVFDGDTGDTVAVLVCGPKGMGANLRREVGRWVGAGRDVFWHSEEFGW